MTKFCRMFPEPWMHVLSDLARQESWWRELLDYRFQGVDGERHWLALAVRNGYLNAYVEGQSVLRISFDNVTRPACLRAKIHHKYLGNAVNQVYKTFDGVRVEGIPYTPGRSLNDWVVNAQRFAKPKSDSGDYSEKQGVAVIAGRNPHVIDLEMGLPGKVAPRIDMVTLERAGSAIGIVFYEAKLFSNPGLRARNSQPKVLEQLDGYETWLTSADRMVEVINAYRETCKLLISLREMQGTPVDELIVEASMAGSNLMVDPRPRLIVFGFKESELDHQWKRHETTLRRAGLDQSRLIMQPDPKNVKLSRGTFPEGCIDEAEDILASCEGMEMVEKMNACIRRDKLSAIARFASVFAKPGFRFATRREAAEGPGERAVPRFHLSEDAYSFIEAATSSEWVELPDWRTWSFSEEAQDLNRNPTLIARASEDLLGKLLTVHIRNDRFHEGALNAAFESGVLTAIVQRAGVLLQS